jgi:hypothetical protein
MRAWKMGVLVMGLGAGFAPLAGCQTPGEPGRYNTMTGNYSGTFDASLEKVHEATLSAMKELGYNVSRDTMNTGTGDKAEVVVRDAAHHDIEIRMKRTTDQVTELTIGQGAFTGSESRARLMFDRIRSHLMMP